MNGATFKDFKTHLLLKAKKCKKHFKVLILAAKKWLRPRNHELHAAKSELKDLPKKAKT